MNFKTLLILPALAAGLFTFSGCADDGACARGADISVMCGEIDESDRDDLVGICEALGGDDSTSCVDCLEGADDPCNAPECDAACD